MSPGRIDTKMSIRIPGPNKVASRHSSSSLALDHPAPTTSRSLLDRHSCKIVTEKVTGPLSSQATNARSLVAIPALPALSLRNSSCFQRHQLPAVLKPTTQGCVSCQAVNASPAKPMLQPCELTHDLSLSQESRLFDNDSLTPSTTERCSCCHGRLPSTTSACLAPPVKSPATIFLALARQPLPHAADHSTC